MCSNNTSNSGGGGGRASSVANASGLADIHHHHHDYASSCLRKAKKQRVPKRGPGVAELEKILREQEKTLDGHVEKGKISSFPNTTTHPPPPHSSFASSSSNSLLRNVTFLHDHNHLRYTPIPPTNLPPPTSLPANIDVNGNGNDNILKGSSESGGARVGGNNGRSRGVYIGGSGVFLPEQTLLPITWGLSETSKGEEEAPKMVTTTSDFSFPILVSTGSDHNKMFPPPMLQKTHPSMMNFFPRSVISSSSTPSISSASSSAGVYHHVEPPSNQKSCHNYTSTSPDKLEDKMMIGAKRPIRPNSPIDNWPRAPPSLPSQRPSFHPAINPRPDPSSSSINHSVFNIGTASCRDPMPTSPLELKRGNPSGNGSALSTLGSPTTPLPSPTRNCQPEVPKFKQFPFQEMMKENSEGLFERSTGSEETVHKKSFFSFFLEPEEQRGASEAALSLTNEKCTEKTGDFIDLNLKL